MYCDVLVIGAGVLGLSSAFHLKRLNPGKRVLVIDAFGGPGQGNTAKSAGIFLNLYTSGINYLLADSTIDWLFHLQDGLGYGLNLTRYGYLLLLSGAERQALKGPIDKLRKRGVELSVFEREGLEHMIPDLVTEFGDEEAGLMGLEPVEYGVLGAKCGCVDTDALAKSIESEFLRLRGEVRYNTTAEGLVLKPEKELGIAGEPFVWQNIRVTGAETNRGEIQAGTTVVAAGVWSERLLDQIGFDTLMRPKKRVIFVFKDSRLRRLQEAKGFSEYDALPFTHIPGISVYLKVEPTEESIWLGCADDFGRKYGLEDDPQADRGLYSNNIYHALVKYFSCFEDVRPVNMWAGQRAINRYDTVPVVAHAPGMIYVGSATGSGITKCDALGRTVATVYAQEREVELYGSRHFEAARIGIEERDVEKEAFTI
jgi:glycine/D-amino acid oxidase-like deaminating enzyme